MQGNCASNESESFCNRLIQLTVLSQHTSIQPELLTRHCRIVSPAEHAWYQEPRRKEGNVLFNDALDTFYFTVI